MKSQKLGESISDVEVTNISAHGFWVFVGDTEYFLPYEQYPWFKDARVKDILNVELHHGCHLRWAQLDVDLDLATVKNPKKAPLIYR